MKKIILLFLCLFFIFGCKDNEDAAATDNQEVGQQIGNTMAGLDESGGSNGQLAYRTLQGGKKLFARMGFENTSPQLLSRAYAESCALANTFSACDMNQITRTFNSCTLGGLVFDGNVTLSWTDVANDSTCQITTNGHSIERKPNWTMTGRRGATLTVTSLGNSNQVITRTAANEFSFTNQDGIQRTFTAAGRTLFDFTTKVNQAMTITGNGRANRTLDGGNLEITNNSTNEVCNLVPANVTWTASCNCATSGGWSGSCTDAGDVSVEVTGCGTGTLTVGTTSENITFDRCYATN